MHLAEDNRDIVALEDVSHLVTFSCPYQYDIKSEFSLEVNGSKDFTHHIATDIEFLLFAEQPLNGLKFDIGSCLDGLIIVGFCSTEKILDFLQLIKSSFQWIYLWSLSTSKTTVAAWSVVKGRHVHENIIVNCISGIFPIPRIQLNNRRETTDDSTLWYNIGMGNSIGF